MATVITSECINCGACEPECPNTAIYQGGVDYELNGVKHPALAQDFFYIVPEKCTECVGFHDKEACAVACPVDCCIPDPQRPETETALLDRARVLHPGRAFPTNFPSRFRKANGAAAPAPPEPAPKPAAAAPSAPAPKPEPAVTVAPAAPPPPAAAAPPAPPVEASSAAPAAPSPVVRPLTPPPPTGVPVAASVPAAAPAAAAFPGELAGTFEDAVARLGGVRADAPARRKWFAAMTQPLLGALSDPRKRAIEAAVGDARFFTVAGATVLNLLYNAIVYPVSMLVLGVVLGSEIVSGPRMVGWIALGLVVAIVEGVFRVGSVANRADAGRPVIYRGAWYGPLAALAFWPWTRTLRPAEQRGTVGWDGFHGDKFEDRIERERRYGEVYTLKELGNGFLLEVELPRRVPESAQKEAFGVPDEMPDYRYELSLEGGFFVVHGHVSDRKVRRLAAVSPAFPPDFTTNVELPTPVRGFKHRVRDKTLEVVLLKDGEAMEVRA